MQTSNKILIAYAILLTGSIITLFTAAKLHEKSEATAFTNKSKPLPDFSVVIAGANTRFMIQLGDSTTISWNQPNDSTQQEATAIVRDDTLFVLNTPAGNASDYVVQCHQLTTIGSNKGSSIHFKNPIQDRLSIIGNGGEITLELDDKGAKEFRNSLCVNLTATNQTHLNSWVPLKTLDGHLNDAQINAYNSIGKLNLQLENKAEAYITSSPSDISIIRDSTSKLTLY